jgi:hypothetical protein
VHDARDMAGWVKFPFDAAAFLGWWNIINDSDRFRPSQTNDQSKVKNRRARESVNETKVMAQVDAELDSPPKLAGGASHIIVFNLVDYRRDVHLASANIDSAWAEIYAEVMQPYLDIYEHTYLVGRDRSGIEVPLDPAKSPFSELNPNAVFILRKTWPPNYPNAEGNFPLWPLDYTLRDRAPFEKYRDNRCHFNLRLFRGEDQWCVEPEGTLWPDIYAKYLKPHLDDNVESVFRLKNHEGIIVTRTSEFRPEAFRWGPSFPTFVQTDLPEIEF